MNSRKNGIIGFFDILGYQSFLDNNEVDEAVNATLSTFASFPKNVVEQVRKTIGSDPRADRIVSETTPLIFSDTILLCSPYADNEDGDTSIIRWLLFVYQAAILQRRLFDFGLPIRGALAFGAYVIHESCFAGRPIVEAYRLATLVDAALICFSETAENEVLRLQPKNTSMATDILDGFAVEYLVPLKKQEPRRHRVVNFAKPHGEEFQSLVGDERSIVSQCFWKHRKDIPPTAYQKLMNTEMALRFLKGK